MKSKGAQWIKSVTPKKLKALIKENIRELLMQELMKFRALLLPSVSAREQKEIEKLYRKPLCKAVKTIKIKI